AASNFTGKRSAHQARALGIELPAGNQVLHGVSVIAAAEPDGLVETMRLFHFLHIDLDAESGFVGHGDLSACDAQRLLGEALPILPDPVSVDGSDLTRSGGGYVREHGERDVEVIVGVRTPGQAPGMAQLGHTYG